MVVEQITGVALSPPKQLIGITEWSQPRHGMCLARDRKVVRHQATYNRLLGVRHFLAYYDLTTNSL